MTLHHLLRFGTRALILSSPMRNRNLNSTSLGDDQVSETFAAHGSQRFHPQTVEESAQIFAQWMRESGYTDYLTPDELDSAYLDHCNQSGLYPLDARKLRNAVRSLDGVFYGRHRIAAPRWYRLRQRVYTERIVLYRIMDYDEFEHHGDRPRPGSNPMSGPVR